MDSQEVEGREREIGMEMVREREIKRVKRKKKNYFYMLSVSLPTCFKHTQINGGAIAFSKRTADRPINAGLGSEDRLRRG